MTEELSTEQVELADLIKNIKMYKWRVYTKYFKASAEEISENVFITLVIAANEKNHNETGKDDLARFDNMNQTEILEFLGFENEQS